MTFVNARWIRRGLPVLFLAVCAAAVEPAAPPAVATPPPTRPLDNATLAPALRAAAERDGIKLFALHAMGGAPAVGDYTVAWIGTRDGGVFQQWLVQIRRGVTSAKEQSSQRHDAVTRYLAWGPVITFKTDVEALELWIAGPVTVPPPSPRPSTVTPTSGPASPAAPAAITAARIRRDRVLVPVDYLRLGLNNSVRVDEHIRRRSAQLQKEDPAFQPGRIYSLSKPVKPENIAYARPVAERIGFNAEMERAWAGGTVALNAFYRLVDDVPELDGIASVALHRPPPWKLAKLAFGTLFKTKLGGQGTRSIDPAAAGLLPVATETFDAPFYFSLGDDPITRGGMVTTDPRAPLDTTAGILALFAVHPKNPTRMVQLMFITAQGAAASK